VLAIQLPSYDESSIALRIWTLILEVCAFNVVIVFAEWRPNKALATARIADLCATEHANILAIHPSMAACFGVASAHLHVEILVFVMSHGIVSVSTCDLHSTSAMNLTLVLSCAKPAHAGFGGGSVGVEHAESTTSKTNVDIFVMLSSVFSSATRRPL
jgi:hypothetical protein